LLPDSGVAQRIGRRRRRPAAAAEPTEAAVIGKRAIAGSARSKP